MCSICLATFIHEESRLWLSLTGHTAVRFYVADDSAVVQASGIFDNGAITPCRAALDAATDTPYPIVLDMRAVASPVRVSVALVGAMRRYAKARGATLTLANVREPWLDALTAAGVAHWYGVDPTAQVQAPC